MSCIEEAAIRQITPLVSIVKLAHGNIGSKGNTTCMWNHSKLCTILPNLPSTCQYFVLSHEAKKKQNCFKINKVRKKKNSKMFRVIIMHCGRSMERKGIIQN